MIPKHLSLDDLIAALEAINPARVLPFGFLGPHSYRGYYEQVAFCLTTNVTVGEMLTSARYALGATFQGWKGGDYTMSGYTECWLVAERGDCGESIGFVLLAFMLAAEFTEAASTPVEETPTP